MSEKGWAVIDAAGKIFVKTVSDTRRAAIINYLMVEKQVSITALHTDEDIESLWAHFGKHVLCTTVLISRQVWGHAQSEMEINK